MSRRLFTIILVVCATLSVSAQRVGDTARQVQAALGNPQLQRTTDAGEIWIYSGGLRLTLQNGIVTEVEGSPQTARAVKPASAPAPYVTTAAPAVAPQPAPPRMIERRAVPVRTAVTPPQFAPPAGKSVALVLAILVIGGLVALVSNILILVTAFKTSVGWGLGSLFVPFVSLIFVITHWQETKKPFLVSLATSVVMVLVAVSTASTMVAQLPR